MLQASWVKITPREPLESGEYAIAFPPKDQVSFSDAVYDFGIASMK